MPGFLESVSASRMRTSESGDVVTAAGTNAKYGVPTCKAWGGGGESEAGERRRVNGRALWASEQCKVRVRPKPAELRAGQHVEGRGSLGLL